MRSLCWEHLAPKSSSNSKVVEAGHQLDAKGADGRGALIFRWYIVILEGSKE